MKLAVKVLWISLAWLLGWTLFYLLNLQTAYSADLPGKKIFQEYKCQGCHAVKSQSIVKEEIKDEEEEESADQQGHCAHERLAGIFSLSSEIAGEQK